MEITVLGPFEVRHNGEVATPSASKPRQLLALLSFQAGQPVPMPALVEEIWGTRPPRSATTTMHTYVRQLRRAIQDTIRPEEGRVAKEMVVTTANGYQLDGHCSDIDVRRYERLANTGRRLLEARDHEAAARFLRSALSLWNGKMLANVRIGMRLGIEVTRLEDSRYQTQLRCAEADLSAGRHRNLLEDLAVLSVRHPTDEQLAELFMLALYRSGQQWRALEAFTVLRAGLAAHLGRQPSARIQRLHQAILNSSPLLDEPYAGPAQSAAE